jgi:organic hydroperoxide reductase OsmC/OhrA
MMGTLARFLAKDQIDTSPDHYQAEVEGDIEHVGEALKITKIRVHYALKAPQNKKEAAERALAAYLPFCPAAQSVIGCIQISHRITLREE